MILEHLCIVVWLTFNSLIIKFISFNILHIFGTIEEEEKKTNLTLKVDMTFEMIFSTKVIFIV